MTRTNKNRAFSLIEVVIAIVITFTLILGTAQLTLNSLWSKKKSDLNFVTASVVSSILENLKSLPFSSSDLQEGDFSEKKEGDKAGLSCICIWQIQDNSEIMKSIKMECYPENAPDKRIRLYLFISRDLGF